MKFGVTPGDVLEGDDRVIRQVDGGFVRLVLGTVEHDGERRPGNRVTRAPRLDRLLGRLLQLDGGEPETVAHVLLAAEDRGGLPELVG